MASVEKTERRRSDALARILLDPLRAGMQVAGASLLIVAAIFSMAPRSGDTGGFTWVGLSFLALIVVAIFGYPGPRPPFLAFLGRAFGAVVWGSVIGVVVLSRTGSVDGEAGPRIVLASVGAVLFALGTWPRRRVAIVPARAESDFTRDVVVAMMVVVLALLAMFPIAAKTDWYLAAIRGSRRAPDGVALVLGAAIGFAFVVTIAASVWMLRRRAAHPWVLALVPPSVLVAIGLAVDRGLMRPVLASSLVTTSPLDDRVAALSDAIGLAWPVWVTTLLVAAALTALASLVIGLRARVRASEASTAGVRPIVTLIAGLLAIVAVVFATAVWMSKNVGSSGMVGAWMALVPAAIGVVALYLAARGGASCAGDALTSASFAGLSVIAIALAQSVRLLSGVDGTMSIDEQARLGSYIASDSRALIGATLPALFPILLALACAIRPRHVRSAVVRAFPFAGAATLTLGLGFASLMVAVHAPIARIGSLWPRENPKGFTLASGSGDACDGLVTSDILFVGPTSIARGGKDLAPITALDTDAGCAALVADLDHGPKPASDLRIAVDSQIAYARVECLARALGSALLRDERSPRPIRRRPRCGFQAVVASRGDHGEPDFPVCSMLRIAGDECNAPKDTEVITLTATTLLRLHDQHVESFPRGSVDFGRSRYDTSPFLLASDGAIRFADVVNLSRRFSARESFDPLPAREAWLVPSDRPSPAMMATLAPPRLDVTESAAVSVRVLGTDDALVAPRRVLDAAHDRFVACQAFGAGKGARSGGSRAVVSIASDGSVTNVWTEARSGSPVVGDCVSRVMSELRFDAAAEPSAIFVDVTARVVRANVIVSDIDDGRGSATRERETDNALRGAADGPLRDCYETGLRATAGRLTGIIRARLQVNRLGRVTFAFAGRPFDEKVVNCSLDALRGTMMPANPPGDYEVHATITMTPPSR